MLSGGTLGQDRLILGLKDQWLLEQYEDLSAWNEHTSLRQILEVKMKLLILILLCKFYIIDLDQGWTEQLMCFLNSRIYLTRSALLFILVQFMPYMFHSLPIALYYSHILLNVIPNLGMDHVLNQNT